MRIRSRIQENLFKCGSVRIQIPIRNTGFYAEIANLDFDLTTYWFAIALKVLLCLLPRV